MGVETPIVALTGNTLQSDKDLFFEAGVDYFQTKVCNYLSGMFFKLDFPLGDVHSSVYLFFLKIFCIVVTNAFQCVFIFSENILYSCYQCI